MRNSLRVFSCDPGKAKIASGYNFFAATIDDNESKSALLCEVIIFTILSDDIFYGLP